MDELADTVLFDAGSCVLDQRVYSELASDESVCVADSTGLSDAWVPFRLEPHLSQKRASPFS